MKKETKKILALLGTVSTLFTAACTSTDDVALYNPRHDQSHLGPGSIVYTKTYKVARDANGNLVKDKDGHYVVDEYTFEPKSLAPEFKGRQVNYPDSSDVQITNYNGNTNGAAMYYGSPIMHEVGRAVMGPGMPPMGPGMGPGGHGHGFGPHGGGRIIDNGSNVVVIGDGGYGYGDYGLPNYGIDPSASVLRVGPNSTVNPTAGTHLGNTLDGTTGYYRNYKTNSR